MRRWTESAPIPITLVALGLCHSACTRGSPPAPEGIDAAVATMPGPSAPAASAADASTTSSAVDASAAGSAVDASVTAAEASVTAAGGDPGVLPQTRDKPAASSPALDGRAAALWEGIVHDDAERAMPFFFPVTAYEQVKAIPLPASDWRRRLVAAYKRDVHGLHERLGDRAASAKLVRLEVPNDRARWVEPNEESNKIGYWRVYGTRIVYETGGKERTLDISSLISWRGEWYVVHLTGFK